MMLLPLFFVCVVLGFVCVLWTLIRIARASGWLALGTFLFWPLGLIHLFRHWGEEGLDIRTPFLAATAFSLLSVYAQYRMLIWATKSIATDQALVQNLVKQAGEDGS